MKKTSRILWATIIILIAASLVIVAASSIQNNTPNIRITYTYKTVQSISVEVGGSGEHGSLGWIDSADARSLYLEVNMTIKNNGGHEPGTSTKFQTLSDILTLNTQSGKNAYKRYF